MSLSPRVIMEPEQATAAASNAAHHHEFSDLAAVAQHDSGGSATASTRPAIGAGVETAFPNTGTYAPQLHAALTTIIQGSDIELSAVLRAAVLRSMALSMGRGTTAQTIFSSGDEEENETIKKRPKTYIYAEKPGVLPR